MPALELPVRARAALGELGAATAACAELVGGRRRDRHRRTWTDARVPPGADLADGARRPTRTRVAPTRMHSTTSARPPAPYDAALARLGLARALAALGLGSSAPRPLGHSPARDEFAAMGAARKGARAEAPLARTCARRGGPGELNAARARHPASGRARPQQWRDRRASRPQPAHGAPAHGERAHQAAAALACRRRRLRRARRVALTAAAEGWPVRLNSVAWPRQAKAARLEAPLGGRLPTTEEKGLMSETVPTPRH